jgi:hypothetical protein
MGPSGVLPEVLVADGLAFLIATGLAEVRRARFGPGLWPGPRRQARWVGRGLRGQRRAAGASRGAGCEAPLRLEEPTQTMRGVPARVS